MKRHWRFLMALMIGSCVLIGPGVIQTFAKPAAQDHGRGRDHAERDHGERDHGRGHGREHENRGRRKKWERDHDGRYRFDKHDHGAVADYYRDHRYRYERERAPEVPIQYGYVVSERYRRYCHPVPSTLVQELPPPPRGFRYFLLSGNIVLLDSGYRVQDFIHISLNFGR